MKDLKRNKRPFYYRLWEGMEEVKDEDGNIVETNVPIFGKPQPYEANIYDKGNRAFQESLTVQMFGVNIDCDKLITTSNTDCPITENTVLYIDKPPYEDGEISDSYDYIVTKVSKSINAISIAAKKVEVS